MEKILIGTITGAFGLKGELKVLSDFEMPDKAFKINNQIYLNDEKYLITNVRFHKNKYLIQIDNIKDINLLKDYRNYKVYIKYSNLNLKPDEYLLKDLINLDVYNNEELIGKVTKVLNDKNNPLININNKFYIPLKSNFITNININDKKITGNNLEELYENNNT
ncbi:MAG: ribosome maturation factor RimM [Bacilli bacterium]|nr:ribosome maturation factor RimM [Bacilli bacterium]